MHQQQAYFEVSTAGRYDEAPAAVDLCAPEAILFVYILPRAYELTSNRHSLWRHIEGHSMHSYVGA